MIIKWGGHQKGQKWLKIAKNFMIFNTKVEVIHTNKFSVNKVERPMIACLLNIVFLPPKMFPFRNFVFKVIISILLNIKVSGFAGKILGPFLGVSTELYILVV